MSNIVGGAFRDQGDAVGGNSLAAGAESPPMLCLMSDSDLDSSVVCVVCPSPMARLVVAPTLAATPTARSGRLVRAPTLA